MGKQVVRFRRNEIEVEREMYARALHAIAEAIEVKDRDETTTQVERSFVLLHPQIGRLELARVPERPRRMPRGSEPIRTWLRARGMK